MGSVQDAEYAFYASQVGDLGSINDVKAAFFARGGSIPNSRALVHNLPKPFYIAHRGAPKVAPESSMTAYRLCLAMNVDVIEQDVYTLADGVACVMHDTTVDRTTDGTGNNSSFNSLTWQRLKIKSDSLMGITGLPVETPPLFEQVCREFGNRITLAPQAYDSDAIYAIDRAIVSTGVNKATVILQTNSNATAAVAKSLNYPYIAMVSNTADSSGFSTAKANGVTHLFVQSSALTSQFISDAHAAGFVVVGWENSSKTERDKYLAMGVDGLFSDDPAYLKGTITSRKTDSFAVQAPVSGFHYVSGANSGKFIAPNEFGWDAANGASGTRRMGYLVPTDASSYTVDFEVNLGVSGLAQVFIGTEDFNEMQVPTSPTNKGYILTLLDASGYRLEDRVNGARVNWLQYNVPITGYAAGAGTWLRAQLVMTPTNIGVTFPATGQTYTVANVVPGRPLKYISIGGTPGAGSLVKFRNFSVT